MKIEEEIKHIIERIRDFILANHTCMPDQKGVNVITDEDFDKAISFYIKDLVNLFKSYARELVPEEKEVENAYPYFGFDEGYNACREEMLRRIEEE